MRIRQKCHKIRLKLQNPGAKFLISYVNSRKNMLECPYICETNNRGIKVHTKIVSGRIFHIRQTKNLSVILRPPYYTQRKANFLLELYSFYFPFTDFISHCYNKKICIRKGLQDKKKIGFKHSKETLFPLIKDTIGRILITLILTLIYLKRGQKWN